MIRKAFRVVLNFILACIVGGLLSSALGITGGWATSMLLGLFVAFNYADKKRGKL